ncbi:putative High affinity cAMP phosphodiesterase [Taphrina deformans PYCC 5710]|uniref:Phosphodiesterase n=1 Tax=Taphrina deformans (strain PYCC 5710 / ATCC 11124 / CBS 356.35 / IMI 108563 / JCM 9778 / NBRC 8474) TaxID=1097556 RepID=R4XC23_TAPDE|nr:putative High affinity cAMP phosphodiesterase [Taphrina deformans PYCC 5710]|eukprot:CCG80890.1 putative High affinity cAMP phosphodiesterase [Taphrina deformans PYCC 5710]
MALNLHISRLRKPKRKSASIEANSARYESEDVKPDEQQWEGLRGRANALVYLPVKHDLVDFHMPPYEALLMPDVRDGLESLESQLPRLHKLVSTWDFSTLQLSEQDLVNCAAVIFKHLFKLPGTEEWHLTDEALFSFIGNIRRAYYTTNPYHNFRHAVDVLQAVFYMLLSSAVLPQMSETCQEFEAIGCSVLPLLMTPQYMLGACIVGIGHDVGHPGVNNALLVATKAPISLLYNDRSVLESMHCAALGRILTQKWPATQQGSMRKVIIELILSTDMALHFDYMSKFKEMEQVCIAAREAAAEQVAPVEPVEIPSATLDKYKVTLFSALIKCGDISNVARPFAISRDWSFVLLKEFFNQARLEKAMGLPVTKNFDPEQTAQADSQMFFINLFAQPLFVSLEKVLPNLMPISRTIASNHDTWKLLKADPQSLATVVDNISRPTSDLNKILAKPLAKSADFEIIRPEDDKVFVDDHNTTVANSGDIHDSQNKSKKSFSLQKLFKRKKSGVPA